MFKKIPPEFLKEIYVNCERIPSLYFHNNKKASDFFWKRLEIAHDMLESTSKEKLNHAKCLDFGCGNGVFFPSLATLFNKVVGVDIETQEAEKIKSKYVLKNVEIINTDLTKDGIPERDFDYAVALDVLEHFYDIAVPVKHLQGCLKKDGFLITSLPTENIFTIMTRKLSGTKKPFDHYHKGREVEKYLAQNGFQKIKGLTFSRFFPLYYITLWKKTT